jgi:hypothetical protein
MYDCIEDTRHQITFKIKELINSYYKFTKALNMQDYVANLLHKDNFIATNILKVRSIHYMKRN